MLMAKRIVLYVGTHLKTIQPLQQVSSTGTCVLNLIASGMFVERKSRQNGSLLHFSSDMVEWEFYYTPNCEP